MRPGHTCAAVNRLSATVWKNDPSLKTYSSLGYQNKNPKQNKNKKKENCACGNSSGPQNRLNLQRMMVSLPSPGCGVLQVSCLKSLL